MGEGDAIGLTAYVLRTGTSMLLSLADIEDLIRQGKVQFLGVPSVDWLGVPLRADGRIVGAMVVQSYRDDVHHTEEDKDLLTFVASHVGAALSRARAIEETRQRNAELALINDVQHGLAANLEMQGMYDLVGDRLQSIFDAQVVDIGIVDRAAEALDITYTIERGVRFPWNGSPSSDFGGTYSTRARPCCSTSVFWSDCPSSARLPISWRGSSRSQSCSSRSSQAARRSA